MKTLYQGLLRITRTVLREADSAATQLPARPRPQIKRLADQLQATRDLVRQVVAQTQARVLRGNTHYPDKVVSVFEPHSEIIRKGKLAKPTEFGRLVKVQEAEAQFITDYEVCRGPRAERELWIAAVDRHIALYVSRPVGEK